MNEQTNFRPTTWDDYHGQESLKATLDIQINSALGRGAPLGHIMLEGPPGVGKTTISQVVANRMGMDFVSFIMPIKQAMLKGVFAALENTVVLFDEFHRLKPAQQEELLPVIEDGFYQAPSGAIIELDRLTIVAATTERDAIIEPLWDRFKIKPDFTPYTREDMTNIILGMANKGAGLGMEPEEAYEFAAATRGVPRAAQKIVDMYRDLYVASAFTERPSVDQVLHNCKITREGWTADHMKYMTTLKKIGGQGGIDMIECHARIPKPTLKKIERDLVADGVITFGPQGRELLSPGYKILKDGASWA